MWLESDLMSDFEGVEDTLYIPLTARIYISKKFNEYFYDSKALELEKAIPNNQIEKKSSEYTMIASVARYYNLDEMTQKFIDRHDSCNIVNLGVGLETSYYRLDRKNAKFFEVDLPDVIQLREKYLEVQENEMFIKGDLFKFDWIQNIDTNLPTLLIVSGVFQYFHEKDIIEFIKNAKNELENAELIFDATSKNGLKFTNFYVKRTGNANAMMYFYINDAEEFAFKTNTKLLESRVFYTDARKILSKKVGLYSRIAMKIADDRKNAIILHLKI